MSQPPQVTADQGDRPLGQAMLRGLRCLCPACGAGSMMQGYLGIAPACPTCGTDLSHQRADDGPAYLTLLVTLKTVIPLMVATMFTWTIHPAVLFAVFGTALVALSLFLLPRFKGMIVAIQWSRRMHGFESADAPAR
ncbi:MAG: DUF983 domain-containing protein [Roseinatronobacter sp.]